MMNENGKKLIESFRWEARQREVGPTMVSYSFTPEELETFAELIVRKCASIADDLSPHQKAFNGTLDLGNSIRKHFGVE